MGPRSRILDPGSRILDPGSRIQDDPGTGIQVPGSWIQDPGSWIPFLPLSDSPSRTNPKGDPCNAPQASLTSRRFSEYISAGHQAARRNVVACVLVSCRPLLCACRPAKSEGCRLVNWLLALCLSRTLDPESRIHDPGSRILDPYVVHDIGPLMAARDNNRAY